MITISKVSETATSIKLGWAALTGIVGYRFTVDGKVSNTFDPTRTTLNVSKDADHVLVEALGVKDSGVWEPVPPPAPPVNTVAPSITGTPAVGQVLTCQPGTWTGNPTFKYQWHYTNADGTGDVPINVGGVGTTQTYTPVADDTGGRNYCVVTATNPDGTTTARTPSTAVITSGGTPTNPSNVPLPNSFLVFNPATQSLPPSSPWRTEGAASSFSIVNDTDLGKALKLAVGPNASGPNPSSYLASVFVNAGVPKAAEGDRTKYRAVIKIPSNFKTSSGEWQFLVEWHVPFTGPYSTCLGVFADGDANQPIVGTNPRFWFEVRGGSISNVQRRRVTLSASEFQLGATYVHDFDFVWSTNSATGRCVWSVNGVVKLDQRQATLYTDGPNNAFGVYNYRKIAPFDTDVLFGVISAAPA